MKEKKIEGCCNLLKKEKVALFQEGKGTFASN